MSRTSKSERANAYCDVEELTMLLDDPDTRAFVEAFADIKDPVRRACLEWLIYALSPKD